MIIDFHAHCFPPKIVEKAIGKLSHTGKIKPFADMFFDYRDGKSTERVVNLIYENLKNNA